MRTILAVFLAAFSAAQAGPLAGHWQGALTRADATLAVSFDFADQPALTGRYSSEAQRAMDYPLDSVSVDGNTVRFVLGGDIRFEGVRNGDDLAGTYEDSDGKGRFVLHRAPQPPLPYSVESVSFRNGDVVLAGTLATPRGKGPFPAVVLLQGSGPETRWGTNRFIADRFARAGIAALIYDKRGSGESGGDWKTADFDDLARDALAAVDLLRAKRFINAARIGLHGHSQGGIVAPDAVRLAPDKIAFVVAEDTIAGPVWQQDIYRVQGALRHDYPPDQAQQAMNLYTLFIEVARGLKPYDALAAAEEKAKGAPWLDWLGLPPKDAWLWAWYRKTGTVDTREYWKAVKTPVLLAYGEKDAIVPVDESVAELQSILAANAAPQTAVIVPGAEHNLTVHPAAGQPFFFWHGAPGFYDLVAAWIRHACADLDAAPAKR